MKIAQIVPVMNTVPPKKYGGIEQIVSALSEGLAKKGHSVDVFASRGSKFDNAHIRVVESAPFPTVQDLSANRKWEVNEFFDIIRLQNEYDLVHFHYEPIVANLATAGLDFNLMSQIKVPFLSTFHNRTDLPEHIAFYKSHKELWDFNYVFISHNHRHNLPFFKKAQVIYNGINMDEFEFEAKPEDYLLFLGRITAVKGILDAISVARSVRKKLIIVAKIDPSDREYYEKNVKRHINGKDIVYAGEADKYQKVKYYKNASALLFPIKWAEPFGLVMVEAMACGTPVIAYDQGSVPELVKNGRTGFVVRNKDEMIKAVGKIDLIRRKDCRAWVAQNFSAEKMVKSYLELYKKLVK
ncbi:MAG: glycosyltransferase family 4 protein [Candidatus Doudnabacteria bacterium]